MELDPIHKITKDLKQAAKTLSKNEARYLVDTYYQMQENRIRAGGQVRSMEKAAREQNQPVEPHDTLTWLGENAEILERNVRSALDVYGDAHLVGRWSKSLIGIGPVISAGLIANIDIERAPTVGHIWRFAGLDPTVTWGKKQKRPWNASLKTLTWKMGESFVKQSGHEEDIYGHLYLERKAIETAHNLAGDFSDQATAKLEKFNIGKDTDTYVWYAGLLTVKKAKQILAAPPEKRQGLALKLASKKPEADGLPMLPPGHVHARAKRWAVKLFLSNWHEVQFFDTFGELPPKPYVITFKGHAHEFVLPNMDLVPGLKKARQKAGRPVSPVTD